MLTPSRIHTHSAHSSPALDRLLAHLVALAVDDHPEQFRPSSRSPSPGDDDDDCVLDLDLARRLLAWLRRLREKKVKGDRDGGRTTQRLAEGLAGLGQRQGWSYDVVEGFRQLAKSLPVAASAGAAAAAGGGATVEQREGAEEEEEGDEI